MAQQGQDKTIDAAVELLLANGFDGLAEVASMPDNKLGTVFVPFLKPHQVAIPLLLIGVLSGLKFMWDIRHPKTN